MTKYNVSLTRYPEEFEVEADTEEEAKNIAKSKVNYSVWESEVEEIENDRRRSWKRNRNWYWARR